MARSHRHKPIISVNTCESEKEDKRLAHRKARAQVREWLSRQLADAENDDGSPPPDWRQSGSSWEFGKDGKMHLYTTWTLWVPLWKLMRK